MDTPVPRSRFRRRSRSSRSRRWLRTVVVAVAAASALVGLTSAEAAPVLTVQPITWNVIGLDSNRPNVGPDTFMVGARACNAGDADATDVTATFVWDGANPYIGLAGPATVSTETVAAGECFDFYFEVVVSRTAAAYDTTRAYHISVSADDVAAVNTPAGRELYVEHLVSQNRNSVQAITGPGGLGDPPATTVFVGET